MTCGDKLTRTRNCLASDAKVNGLRVRRCMGAELGRGISRGRAINGAASDRPTVTEYAPGDFQLGPHQSTIFAATLTLLFAASMQAQTRVGLTQDVQGLLHVVHENVPAAVGDHAVSSNGTGQPGMYRVKPSIDVRDWGVDCTGTDDAAAILNSHTNVQDGISGQTIVIPTGCVLNLTSGQWQIYGNEGFKILGSSILSTKSPLVMYTQAARRPAA
jgi:hypothetical protein